MHPRAREINITIKMSWLPFKESEVLGRKTGMWGWRNKAAGAIYFRTELEKVVGVERSN